MTEENIFIGIDAEPGKNVGKLLERLLPRVKFYQDNFNAKFVCPIVTPKDSKMIRPGIYVQEKDNLTRIRIYMRGDKYYVED